MIYIAMLRGINVGGKNPFKMERLRELFEELGFKKVETYVQSGNVVFHGSKASVSALTKRIESALLKTRGFPIPVILRTSVQLTKAIKLNPFLKIKNIDPSKLHVTFLAGAPSMSALEKLDEVPAKPDQLHAAGEEIYMLCPNGYGRTKLSNNVIERLLDVKATTRNWKTVMRLHEMSCE